MAPLQLDAGRIARARDSARRIARQVFDYYLLGLKAAGPAPLFGGPAPDGEDASD